MGSRAPTIPLLTAINLQLGEPLVVATYTTLADAQVTSLVSVRNSCGKHSRAS